jgi:16S rRNA (cytosine1402-N4)-methyltransferase
MSAPHTPVLYHEIIHALQPKNSGRYVDGTLGSAGHAAGILEASAPEGKLLGLDLDPQALALAKVRLSPFEGRTILRQASYTQIDEILRELDWKAVDGVVLDLGVSSMQLDTPERGFSFQHDAPLDMRFGPDVPLTAADLVNRLPESALADIILRYGEDRHARRIAKAIIRARPLQTTKQLSETVAGAIGMHEKIHPATRTFQALRIAVNEELRAVENVLPKAIAALKPGGRLAVISFHSLEDRIVKNYFLRERRDCICPPKQPVCTCGHKATIKVITRKPITPADNELSENPRARSAKLRIAEKLKAVS